jgi:kynurenine formamidase/predicted enzyme related to lactoylglutathione lyase
MARYVDLSHDVRDGMLTYPGLPAPRLGSVLTREASRGRYDEGVEFDIGSIELCTNTGTYLDTPFHRYADGHDLTGLLLERCVDLPAVVVRVDHPAIGPGDIPEGIEGAALLLHTGWSEHFGTERYFDKSHPYLTPEAVDVVLARGAVLVGIDSLNIDSAAGGNRTAHTKLLAADIAIVEHLTNLAELPQRGARFTAVPVKVAGLGTFPVRAFATVTARPTVVGVVVDCADVRLLSSFWANVTGGTARVRSDEWATVSPETPGSTGLGLQKVPEGKVVKNRVHLDIWSDDIPADTARAVAWGAHALGGIVTDDVGQFQVLQDPEGNEFCLVSS